MKRIQLWTIEREGSRVAAKPAEPVDSTETEELLEDLLVSSPELLEPGLNLVGRQVPCEGGYLDLLGIDQDGRVTIFELKRGPLTRDAVAQILDYASDLASFEQDRLAKLIEENSGRLGVDKIEDFADWYSQEYPNAAEALSDVPKMVLVGLGVDDRARRIVSFLASKGLDIQLLTFHAFREGGRLSLARQVEVAASPRLGDAGTSITKEGNREVLLQRADELGLKALLEEVRAFAEARLEAYCWPGKTAYSFSLQEKTPAGRPTLRSYATLYTEAGPPASLLLVFAPRSVAAAGAAVDKFCESDPQAVRARSSYSALETRILPTTWRKLADPLGELLSAIHSGWEASLQRGDEE